MVSANGMPGVTEIRCEFDESPVRIVPIGDMADDARSCLRHTLELIDGSTAADVVVDLSAVTVLGGSGLRFLVALRDTVRASGHDMTVHTTLPHRRTIIRRAGLADILA